MLEEVAAELEHDPLTDAREPEPGPRPEHPRRRVDADVREHGEREPLLVAGSDAVVVASSTRSQPTTGAAAESAARVAISAICPFRSAA